MDLNTLKLSPQSVKVEGIDEPVEVTRFSYNQFQEVSKKVEGEPLEVAALYFLNDEGYGHSDEDVNKLKSLVGAKQIRDIYRAGLIANGISAEIIDGTVSGADPSVEEAKKN